MTIIDRPTTPEALAAEIAPIAKSESKEAPLSQVVQEAGIVDSLSLEQNRFIENSNSLFIKFGKLFNTSMPRALLANNALLDGKTKDLGLLQLGHYEPVFKLPKDFDRIKPPKGLDKLLNGKIFFAGVFKRNGKRVGLLRISSYIPAVSFTMPQSVRYYLSELQKRSDVLIIDQTDNAGGALVLSDFLIEGLVGNYDVSKHIRFAVKPTQTFLAEFVDIGTQVMANENHFLTADQQKFFTSRIIPELQKVKMAYDFGMDLSEPVSLLTTTQFLEDVADQTLGKFKKPLTWASKFILRDNVFEKAIYTKPVFFLTNELDFSAADMTPAVFQDYGRGKVVGVHTAGAGGTVEEFTHRISTEFGFALTSSLMVRKDGSYVENRGVIPDIPFSYTVDDYSSGFSGTLDRLMITLGL